MKQTAIGALVLLMSQGLLAGTVISDQKIKVKLADNISCETEESNTGYIPQDFDVVTLKNAPTAQSNITDKTLLPHPSFGTRGLPGLCSKMARIPLTNGLANARLHVVVSTGSSFSNPKQLSMTESATVIFSDDVEVYSTVSAPLEGR